MRYVAGRRAFDERGLAARARRAAGRRRPGRTARRRAAAGSGEHTLTVRRKSCVSGLRPSRISPVRYSATERSSPEKLVRKAAASSVRRSASAASRSPAAQPSVRACSTATCAGRQLEAGGRQQRGGVVEREAQDVGPQLVQPALQPEPGDGDRRVGPAGQDEPQRPPAGGGSAGRGRAAPPARSARARRRGRRRTGGPGPSSSVGESLDEVRVRRQLRQPPATRCRRRRPEASTAARAARPARPTTAAAGRCRRRPARSRPSRGPRRCGPSPPAAASCRTRPER